MAETADPVTRDTTPTPRARDVTALVSALMEQLAGSNTPRSSVHHILVVLQEQGYLTFERPTPLKPLGPDDCLYLVRAIEDAGFRIAKGSLSETSR